MGVKSKHYALNRRSREPQRWSGCTGEEKHLQSVLQLNHSLPSTSHPCHYTDYTVLTVTLLAKERNNVHAVELEVLTAAVKSGTDRHQLQLEKYNLETQLKMFLQE